MTQDYVGSREEGLSKYLSKAYLTVALGVGISGIIAFVASMFVESFFYRFGGLASIISIGLVLAELGVAIYFSARINAMNKSTAWVCYILYSVLTGLSFSVIIYAYLPGSVAMAFAATAIMFVCMAIIGSTSKVNFSKAYMYLLPFLISSIIISLLNAFIFHSAWIDMAIVYIGLILFLFITAADAKKLQEYYYATEYNDDTQEKMMVVGAFSLYLDFVNMFIHILEIIGRRKRD